MDQLLVKTYSPVQLHRSPLGPWLSTVSEKDPMVRVVTPWQEATDLLANAAWKALRGEGHASTVRLPTPHTTASVWATSAFADPTLESRPE